MTQTPTKIVYTAVATTTGVCPYSKATRGNVPVTVKAVAA